MKALLRFVLWLGLAVAVVAQPIRPWLNPGVSDPRDLTGLAAWYDVSDTSSMLGATGTQITDGGAVALWGDKSGNSGTLCYVSGVAASNSVSSPNKSVTGNQTFTLDVGLDDYSPAGDLTIVSKLSGNDGFAILLLTTGVVRLRVGDGASVTNVDSTAAVTNTDFARRTIGIAWTDGVGASFTLDGAALGTAVAAVKTLTNAAVACTIGTITGRIYRVQVGSVYDFNPAGTTAKKLANGDTLTTGGDVWTLASSGATGARIAGERDLFNGVLANRPTYLAYSGTKYGWNNATNANTFTTPDSAAVSITGDIDIRCRLALTAWTTGSASQDIVTRWETSNQSYLFRVNSTGTLRFITTADGSTAVNAQSTAAVSFAANEAGWIRVTRDVDNGAGGNTTRFYTSSDGETWAQLGDPVVVASTTSIFDGTAVLRISGNGLATDTGINGKIYRAQIYDGIGGTLKADFNPALYTSGTTLKDGVNPLVDWTVQGGAHIVTRTGLYFDGSNDYLKTAAFALSQPETVYVVQNQVSWTSGDVFFDGNAANSGAILQTTSSPRISINAGSTVAENTGYALKTSAVLRSVFNGASSALGVNRVAATTGNAGAANLTGITVGAGGGGSNPANSFVCEVSAYGAAQDNATQNSVALYEIIKWDIVE